MPESQSQNTVRQFDYVCLHCGRVHQQRLDVLVPGGSFNCPYCKSIFYIADGKIRMKERSEAVPVLETRLGDRQRIHLRTEENHRTDYFPQRSED